MTIIAMPNRHENEINVRIKEGIAASPIPLDDMSFKQVLKIVEQATDKLSTEGRDAAIRQWLREQASEMVDLELGRRVFSGLDEWDLSFKSNWEDVEIALFRHCGFISNETASTSVQAFYVDCQRRGVAPALAVLEFEAALRKGLPGGLSLTECAQRKVEAKDPEMRNAAGCFLVVQRRVDETIAFGYPDGLPDEFFPKGRKAL